MDGLQQTFVFWVKSVLCAMPDVQDSDNAAQLVNRIDDPVTVPPATVKQVTQLAAFENECSSSGVFIKA